MAKAIQLSSGSWRCKATKTINGKQITKSFTVSPKDCAGNSRKARVMAEKMAKDWILDAESTLQGPDAITVERAIDEYIASREPTISQSTTADYLRMKKYFTSILDVPITEVTTKMLQDIIGEMAVATNRYGKNINERTIKNRIFFLLACFKFEEHYKVYKLKFPVTESNEYLPPEKNEYQRLLDVCETDEQKLVLMLCGLYTLRRSELCGLTGKDILWDMHSVYIHSSRVHDKNREWVLRPIPKKKQSIRTVTLDPSFMQLIPHVGPDEYIVKINPDQVTKLFIRLRKKACVSCRLHDLRKFAASTRSDMMMPKKYIEKDGGWKAGSSVLTTVYDKTFREERKNYAKQYNDMVKSDYGKQLLG